MIITLTQHIFKMGSTLRCPFPPMVLFIDQVKNIVKVRHVATNVEAAVVAVLELPVVDDALPDLAHCLEGTKGS